MNPINVAIPSPVLLFRPPLVGFESTFNTIRAGKKWMTRLIIGQRVILVDQPGMVAFAVCEVTYLEADKLTPLCHQLGWHNHTQVNSSEEKAIRSLNAAGVVRKMYGPAIATEDKIFTAIGLTRLDAPLPPL